jgi:TonB-linked SusC/RagA family outer membrane protein
MKQCYSSKKTFFFVIFLLPIVMMAQITITGQITKELLNGETIPFVNVIEKNSSNGTTADVNGNFSIEVASLPTVLVFSSLGYETQQVPISDTNAQKIVLKESATALEAVVVTGLASSIKRSNAANAVSVVTAAELTGVTSNQTLDGALRGKIAGAQITQSSGAPGGGLAIKLRGVTSVNGNSQPLYIIDGVYVNNSSISGAGLNFVSGAARGGNPSSQDNPSNRIADLNPDDIDRIEILKGASAAAIYGNRGAAGVIIITTKKGKAGKTEVNLRHDLGFNTIIRPRGTRDFNFQRAEDSFGQGNGDLYNQALAEGSLIDYEDQIFGEEGIISNTSASISGGSVGTRYYAAFSNIEENGIVKNTGYDKKSIRLNLDHRFINDRAKLSVSTNYITSSSDRGFFNNDNSGTTIGVALTSTPPWARLSPDQNGVYLDNPFAASNPLQTRDLITNNENVNRFIVGSSLDFEIFKNDKHNLKLILNGGLDYFTLINTAIFPKELQFQKPINGGLNGVTARGNTVNKDANYSAFLVHTYSMANDINFTTQGGLTKQTFSQSTERIVTTDLIGSETNIDQGANSFVNQVREVQEDAGFFVQEEVNYQDKLIATLGLRGDKSSNNGDANEIFYYPKASLALNLNEFGFWNEVSTVSRLKLRSAYGEAGTFAPNGALFTVYGNSLIDGLIGITVPGGLGDPNISPERQKEFEIGIDAGFFKNRVSLELTYYVKTVEDLVLRANIEPSSGFVNKFANAGELQNRGFEATLNASVVDNEKFSYNTTFLFFKNKSEVTRLDVDAFNTGGFGTGLGTFRIEEGQSVTQIVGTREAGGRIEILGNAEPDFQLTWSNDLKYDDFTLSFLWHWKKGGDNINLSNLLFDFGGTSEDYDTIDLDPNGELGNGLFRTNAFLGGNAAPFVEDASYLRLREIGLYYNLPQEAIKKAFGNNVESLKVGISGNNLVNIFDYNSYDPEVSNFGSNGLSTGVEVTPYPSSKRYLFSVAVGF